MEPVPLTIRLLHENVDPGSVKDDLPPPPKSPSSCGDKPGDGDATPKKKSDSFYKAWDRFMAASHKSAASSSSTTKPPAGASDGETATQDTRGNAAGMIAAATESDTDSPGRPEPFNKGIGQKNRENTATSFQDAEASCRSKVQAIARECRRLNKKYHDPLFPLPGKECLTSLKGLYWKDKPSSLESNTGVQAAKRVGEIFDDPQFAVDGMTASDVKQGQIGDCWFLAAITSLSSMPDLLMRLCVARDEQAGVYGFCFFRDGQWIYEVVDDRLCVRYPEDPQLFLLHVLEDGYVGSSGWDSMVWERLPKEMLQKLTKGSRTLYFSSCKEGDETWLPLMEKAYAKAHGDYQAIEGGFTGEGIEDLTGGVNVTMFSQDVLDKDRLWEELKQVNKTFLFGCGPRAESDISAESDGRGLISGHAYTILEAREVDGAGGKKEKLIKIRNPWGQTEWKGAWSDGSKEWTPEMMKELGHRFGNDGIFWMSYEDWLKNNEDFDRTRLFGKEWTLTQQWTTVEIPQSVNYLDTEYIDTKFSVIVEDKGPIVIVLSQPDDRYFRGLTGRFSYDLHFRLCKDGEGSYLVRSMEQNLSGRSCSAELELEPGSYSVRMKISPQRFDSAGTPEEVFDELRKRDEKWITEKLLAVGKSFDAAHSKGHLRETEVAIAKRVKRETKKSEHDKKRKKRGTLREERRRKHLRSERKRAEEEKKKEAKRALKKAKKQANQAAPTVEPEAAKPEDARSREESEETVAATVEAPPEEASRPSQLQEPQADDTNGFEKVEAKPSDESNEEITMKKEEGMKSRPEEDETKRDDGCSDGTLTDASSVVDEDFEWDSEIDGSVEESEDDDQAENDNSTDEDPWRAVCVVGLRVYSTSSKTKLEVVSPAGGNS